MVNMTPWRISKDEIIAIAMRKGIFTVPKYLYRAESMAKKCRELVRDGKLRRSRKLERALYKSDLVYVITGVVSPTVKAPITTCNCPNCGKNCGNHDSYLAHYREAHDRKLGVKAAAS